MVADDGLCLGTYEKNVKRVIERRSKLSEHIRSAQSTRHGEIDGRM